MSPEEEGDKLFSKASEGIIISKIVGSSSGEIHSNYEQWLMVVYELVINLGLLVTNWLLGAIQAIMAWGLAI